MPKKKHEAEAEEDLDDDEFPDLDEDLVDGDEKETKDDGDL